MANVKTDERILEAARAAIKNNSTKLDSKYNPAKPESIIDKYSTRFTVTMTDYMKFQKENGISEDVMDKILANDQAWNTAAAEFARDALLENQAAALADSEFIEAKGMNHMKSTVMTSDKLGRRDVIVGAYSTGRNPKTGDPTETFGSICVKHRVTRGLDTESCEGIVSSLEAAFKGKF